MQLKQRGTLNSGQTMSEAPACWAFRDKSICSTKRAVVCSAVMRFQEMSEDTLPWMTAALNVSGPVPVLGMVSTPPRWTTAMAMAATANGARFMLSMEATKKDWKSTSMKETP